MSISPGKYPITIYKSRTFTLSITWTDQTNTPINLSGYSVTLMARANLNAPPFLTMSTTNGLITLGGAAGTIALNLPSAQTAALPALTGIYDMEITDPSGNSDTLIYGQLSVIESVTR